MKIWMKEIIYWIDAKTNLLYQSSQKISGGFGGAKGGEMELVTVFKDYKDVEGVMFPFTAELKGNSGNMGGGTMVYEKIEVNKPVDEKLYKAE